MSKWYSKANKVLLDNLRKLSFVFDNFLLNFDWKKESLNEEKESQMKKNAKEQ